MPNFGKYAILQPVTRNFKEEPDWNWSIQPPSLEEELAIAKFLNSGSVTQRVDGIEKSQVKTSIEIAIEEVALLFGGTNIPKDEDKPVEEGGKPFIDPKNSIDVIRAGVKALPPKMLFEVWAWIGEAVPGWGPIQVAPKNSPSASGQ